MIVTPDFSNIAKPAFESKINLASARSMNSDPNIFFPAAESKQIKNELKIA